jgi:hypothetical protein
VELLTNIEICQHDKKQSINQINHQKTKQKKREEREKLANFFTTKSVSTPSNQEKVTLGEKPISKQTTTTTTE